MHVLIAEDDPVSSRVLAAMLARQGHDVVSCADGEEAWRAFEQGSFDAVISDWMMPRVDGLELVRRIRAQPRERYTYVMLLTALSGRERFLDGMAAGADDFVTKPVDRDELRARLRVAERILALQREVKTLQGLLPICSYCKRIRDGEEEWVPVEVYVSRASDARFSHGICPHCMTEHITPQLESL